MARRDFVDAKIGRTSSRANATGWGMSRARGTPPVAPRGLEEGQMVVDLQFMAQKGVLIIFGFT